jgi:hypothetical protein
MPRAPTLTLLVTALSLNACVVGAESPPTRRNLRTAPPARPVSSTAAGALLRAEQPALHGGAPAEKDPPPPGQVWVAGYFHDDGVRYTWVPGHYEAKNPQWTWRRPHE